MLLLTKPSTNLLEPLGGQSGHSYSDRFRSYLLMVLVVTNVLKTYDCH